MARNFNCSDKVQIGFALSAYVSNDNDNQHSDYDSRIGSYNELRPAIRFKNIGNIIERNFNDYGENADGCDCFECEVNDEEGVGIYVNDDLVCTVEPGQTIMIV